MGLVLLGIFRLVKLELSATSDDADLKIEALENFFVERHVFDAMSAWQGIYSRVPSLSVAAVDFERDRKQALEEATLSVILSLLGDLDSSVDTEANDHNAELLIKLNTK